MKKIAAIIMVLMLIPSSCFAIGMLNYLDQYSNFSALVDAGQYDELIQSVRSFKTDHPLLMTDEWENKIADAAVQARDAFVPAFTVEYDPFEDIELKWFADHKQPSPDDPCVIQDGTNGLILNFCIPVDFYININDYICLVNGSERFNSTVDNWDARLIGLQKCETFYIGIEYLAKQFDVEQYDSIAFRFYGDNHDDSVDLTLDEETVGYFRQVTADTVTASDVKDVLWAWAKDIDDIVDETMIPAFASRMMKNNPVPIYPSDIPTSVYWTMEKDLTDDILSGKWNYVKGRVFFFPCEIESVNVSSEEGTYSYWGVYIRSEYGQVRRFASILIPVNHPLENHPAKGDVVLVAATYSQKGTWGPIFFLGYEEDVIKEAKAFTQ